MADISRAVRVLLLGGHGTIARMLTPFLLARRYDVFSVIRNKDHEQDILKYNQPGTGRGVVSTVLRDIAQLKSRQDAQALIGEIEPDYVVWAAGAGGKGGPEATFAIDQDAAKQVMRAAISTPSVTKFLMISHIGSRRRRAPWWTDDDWESVQRSNNALPDYYRAKLEADEYLTALATERTLEKGDKVFQAIDLRPTLLLNEPATRRVELGQTGAASRRGVTREDVAIVADKLLARPDTRGYIDLVSGDLPIDEAIEEFVNSGVSAIEGEDIELMRERFKPELA